MLALALAAMISDQSVNRITVVVGGLFVVLYAMSRFNTPVSSRSSTTAFRYHIAQTCYLMVSLLIFAVLLRSPGLLESIVGEVGQHSELFKQLSSPFLAALFVTLFLPKVPILSEVDKWIRDRLHDVAAIPVEVLRLVARLHQAEWTVEKLENVDTLKDDLVESGLRDEDVQFQKSPAPQFPWTKLSTILLLLDKTRTESRPIGFLVANDADWRRIQQRHAKLKKRAPDVFSAQKEKPENEGVMGKLCFAFHDDCKDLLADAYLMLARLTLQCDSTAESRRERLLSIGFQPRPEPKPGLSIHQIAAVFMAVFLILMVPILGLPRPDEQFKDIIIRLVMISTIYATSVFWATYPKKWSAFVLQPNGARPWGGYMLATLFALITSAMISFSFRCLITQNVASAWAAFKISYVWLLMTASTTFGISLLADDDEHTISPSKLRTYEALAQGALNAVASCLVYLNLAGPNAPTQLGIVRVMTVCGMIGLVLGWTIPTWYRRARIASAARREECGRLREALPDWSHAI